MNRFIFRIKSKIYRELAGLFNYRPTSYPYISGDGFRAMADHIYDETYKCKAFEIKDGSVVFLKTDMIKEWFEQVHPKITAKYKLITHNSDACVGETEARLVDDKIIHWFAQNNVYEHPKISPIPIGIENKHWFMSGWVICKFVNKLRRQNNIKNDRILFGFNANTNAKERTGALEALRKCPMADEITERLDPPGYFKLLNRYRFVASPDGNGPDCHRTWEAMILGSIPIIRNASDNMIFSRSDLIIMTIENWKEIAEITKERLQEIGKKYNVSAIPDAVYFDYWKKTIENTN